ncbi:MAG TPA: hypothetical protein VMZ28_06720 [Kofleriaceae bacterium]|nr:hypothetical protein [Kofleriaceae bacterium]
MTMLRRRLGLSALLLALCLPLAASAATRSGKPAARPLKKSAVRKAAGAYATERGYRPGVKIEPTVLSVTASGKSTRATLTIGARTVDVLVDNATGRLQPRSAQALLGALAGVHQPLARSEARPGSRFAVKVRAYRPGTGAGFGEGAWTAGGAPLGRPRAGQTANSVALDAVALGRGGSIELELGQAISVGRRGAGVRVRENGLGSGENIVNQTPGLVEVSDGTRWYRLGRAGFKTAGDLLLFSNALDRIPPTARITAVRVTDAPGRRVDDTTDNLDAAGHGPAGFDLVSVEGIAGQARPGIR